LHQETGTGFQEDVAKVLFQQLLEAMELMHSKKIAHWDMKPQNIICDSHSSLSSAKITDFGLSHRLDVDGEVTKFRGTAQYCSPEMLENQFFGVEADMWSLGCILYLMLSGKPAFSELNFIVLCELVNKAKYNLEGPEWVQISSEAKDLIRKLLCVDHMKRLTATQALQHPWIVNQTQVENVFSDAGMSPPTRRTFQQQQQQQQQLELHPPHNSLLRAVFSKFQDPSTSTIPAINLPLAFAEFGLRVTPVQIKILLHRYNHQSKPPVGMNRSQLNDYLAKKSISKLLESLTQKILIEQPEDVAAFVLTQLQAEASREWETSKVHEHVTFAQFADMFHHFVSSCESPILILDAMTLFFGLDDDRDLVLNRQQFVALFRGAKRNVPDESTNSFSLKACMEMLLESLLHSPN
jgi:serine/threonine protein kinase